MSAVPADVAPGPALPAALRRIPARPAEGWLTFAFVVLMAATVAWSLDDAAWVLGRAEWGDFYVWAALFGTCVGFVGAKAAWPRWVAHVAGALVAAVVLPLMVGSVILPDATASAQYRAVADAVVGAWYDLAILDRPSTNQTAHFLLAIGAIPWSVGQFAGYAVFGHRRPLDAVIVVGIVLLANMAVTKHDQIGLLVVFSVAALAILARTHALEEESTWIRRRIGDGSAIRSIYLRGGAVFIAAAVFGSLVLTASASSNPLAPFWRGFDRNLLEWSQNLQRYLPFGGAPRPLGFGFGRQAAILDEWTGGDTVAVTIQRPPGDDASYYWRAVTFDRFELDRWTWSNPYAVGRAATSRTLGQLAEDPTPAYARRDVTFTVNVESRVDNFALSPLDPIALDHDATVQVVGAQGWLSAIEVDAESYTVVAAVPAGEDEDNALTENRLKAAGTNYPDEIRALYLQLPPDALLADGRRLFEDFLDEVGPGWTPYELARTIELRFRHDPSYQYRDNVRGLCRGISAAECFARYKQGFCLHYATTMAVLLREAGVPARLVEGFLPGTRDPGTGVETITVGGAHAWVEVYFPGFGWYAFDPTGGNRTPGFVALPSGPPVTPAPSALPSFGSVRDERDVPDPVNQGPNNRPPGEGGNDQSSAGMLIAIALVLLIGVGGAAFVAWQRGPRGELTADSVWRGIASTAARFGFGPRPQQTVYEYAGVLGDVLPGSRPELQTVARAKVEVAYGRRELGDDARRTLRHAHRRLRLALLRLAFRRADRRRMKGR